MRNDLFNLLVFTALLLGLPLLGISLAGHPSVGSYLAFPPLTRQVPPAPFSWSAFVPLALISAVLLVLVGAAAIPREPAAERQHGPSRPFPGWGWLGLLLLALSWTLAWARFPWFAELQAHSFTPLWLAYILVVNALCYRRAGRCLLVNRPGLFLALFPFSAVFWWYFEYLNRFVQNWNYVGVADFTGWQYAFFATLNFTTVLPAVVGTTEWLASHPRLNHSRSILPPIHLRRPKAAAWAVLAVAVATLGGIGVWPDYLYSFLWVSPLLIILALEVLVHEKSYLSPLTQGDWRPVYLPALAALICGFFWEMWNNWSLAKWEYSVAFVHRFQIFEMPLLGYAGYLPFGLVCVVIAGQIARLGKERQWIV